MSEQEQQIEDIFEQADHYMINTKEYDKAKELYQKLIALDDNNIDAYNSLAQWIMIMSEYILPYLKFWFLIKILFCLP